MKLTGAFRWGTVILACGLGIANLAGQQTGGGGATGGGGGATGGGGGGTGTTTPPSTGGTPGGGRTSSPSSTNTTPSNTQQQTPQFQQPIYISGRVVLEDGTQPSGQIVIERVCQARTYREGYADSKGYFNIQLGQNNGVFADASTDLVGFGGANPFGGTGNSGVTEQQLNACELRASLAGYRSDTLPMFNIRPLNRNDVGTIILHYFGNVQGLTTSATSALAPKDAKKSFERGTKAMDGNKPDEAQKELQKAVDLYPRFAEAWYQLGRVYERRDHKAEAREAYLKAIAADGNFVNPYERLYSLAASANDWQEAAERSDKVLRLNPYDFPGAYYINAVANFQLKKFDAAEKSARESAKLTGKRAEPKAYYVLGLTLAQKGEFGASSESLKTYLKVAPPGTNLEQVQKILADVDRMAAQARPALATQ